MKRNVIILLRSKKRSQTWVKKEVIQVKTPKKSNRSKKVKNSKGQKVQEDQKGQRSKVKKVDFPEWRVGPQVKNSALRFRRVVSGAHMYKRVLVYFSEWRVGLQV